MPDPSGITNRHRLDYLLDVLAESFPEKAKLVSCACGTKDKGELKTATNSDGEAMLLSKRDLVENALLEAFKLDFPDDKSTTLDEALGKLSDKALGKLLRLVPVDTIDVHLRDLALFLDSNRQTTLGEVKSWDTRHASDLKINKL